MKRSVLAGLLLVALACGGGTTPEEPPTPAEPAPVPEAPAPAEPPPAPPEAPPEPPPVLSFDADPIPAFTDSCAASFLIPTDLDGDTTGECRFVPSTEPLVDHFGCQEKGDACAEACAEPCEDCQSACVAPCEDCKAGCGGDADCITDCAQQRQDCRESCLQTRRACEGFDCAEVVSDCEKNAELTIRRTCPRCEDITACILESYREGNFAEDPCRKLVPASEDCHTWCHPGSR